MANFTFRFDPTTNIQLATWNDPNTALQPSRLNPVLGLPHRYFKVPRNGSLMRLLCRLESPAYEGPPDSLLGGNLFVPYWIETPYSSGPALEQDAGFSSIITFRCTTPGHYLLGVFRNAGGQQLLHFMCE